MNDNSVSLYNFHNHDIRVVMLGGEPWFVAADVCRALGLNMSAGTSQHTSALNIDEKQTLNLNTVNNYHAIRGNPNVVLISESGLYKLILRAQRSRPEVARFQDWVTRDVLPAIRKDGGYIKGEEKVLTGEMSEEELLLKAFTVLNRKAERLQALKEAELDVMPVNKFLAHHDVYAGQPMRNRLSNAAKKLCLARDIEVTRRRRVLEDGRETYANEYPHSILVEAAADVGLTLLNNRYRPELAPEARRAAAA